ncbi:MAG: ABC transporter ATP-binding protein [Anaerolineaceae bacterium]
MKRLIKYIKPYWPYIILTIGLLYVMANADLALPDYLSQIVNVGIQQNGIESTVPEAMRKSEMEKLALFQAEEEHTQTLAAYSLVEPQTPQAAEWVEKYPKAETEAIYVLNTTDEATLAELKTIMSKPLVLIYGINILEENPEQAASLLGENFSAMMQSVPAGTDIINLFDQMPAEQRSQLLMQIDQHLAALEGTMLDQMAVRAIGGEYTALGVDLEEVQTNYILQIGGQMILMALLAAATSISVSYLAARTSASVARDIRSALFKHVEQFSSSEFNNFSTASLITRTTNDISQIQQVVFMVMRMAFTAPIMGIGGVIRAIDKSPSMWWLIALAVGILILIITLVFIIAMPKFKIMQSLIDRLNLVIRENLSGLMVVRAFNKQGFEEERVDKANKKLTNTNLFIGKVMTTVFPTVSLVMTGLSVLIIWVGAHEVAQSTLQIGNMIAFMQYSNQIMFSFINLAMLLIFLPRAAVSGDRIADVLETPIAIQDPAEPVRFASPVQGKVEFVDVDFSYPGAEEDVLHDISFTAYPGQTTSIIGSTGSGKSTLINLVPRFFEVSKGSILVDGVDIRNVTQHDLREQIGFIPQKGLLFSGTIASNLKVSKPQASEADMLEAIDIAQASEFVLENPDGLEAEISQGGTNLSGGQRQRLSIARALVKKPPIYIFDDSFSALDFKTDAALRQALKQNVNDSTVLIVTQRVATAKTSDQILVLDNGHIVGKGTHHELMETCQTYQEIAKSQLSMEELA